MEQVVEVHKTGQPILIGTISIETSEMLSDMLKRRGVKHEVLNAKNHEKEAEIVAQAGRFGAVTIATNMAGRGTDIILGGNPEIMTVKEMKKRGYEDHLIAESSGFSATDDEEIIEARKLYQEILAQKKLELKEEQEKVKEAGGLFILGTERHESRRIDNQLRGRAGRQGDPGTTRFFISLEDELMRLFGSERIQGMVEKLGMEEDDAIEHKMLSKSIESAQKKVEGKNFSIRKSVLQYDDVMNKQREIIYAERKRVLEGENIKPEIMEMIDALADAIVDKFCPEKTYQEEWDIKGLKEKIQQQFAADINIEEEISKIDNSKMKSLIKDMARRIYEMKESMLPEEEFRELERVILLQVVDSKWMDHIDSMDQLRQGMGLRAIGQEDPVRAYQIEGFDMFDAMTESIKEETVRYLMSFQIQKQEEKPVQIQRKAVVDLEKVQEGFENSLEEKAAAPKKTEKVVGRNEECPCGSGKKYKKCCGKDQ